MFLQIHFLTSHHASLLNRDDAGLAKRITFGGVPRLRVSSQCQKKHWRDALIPTLPDLPFGIRSRLAFQEIAKEARRQGVADERVHSLTRLLGESVMTLASGKRGRSVFDDAGQLLLAQPILLGRPEIRYLASIVADAAKESPDEAGTRQAIEQRIKRLEKKNLLALMRQAGMPKPACGVEGALFGRFITSDILARVDAPVHVAHAFTVHALQTEMDYFTVVDDLLEEQEETGAAHVNETELGTGIFYGYVAMDLPLLVSNFTGCDRNSWRDALVSEPAVCRVIESFIRVVAQTSPGAKLGATAPHTWAELILLEVGKSMPRSLANAYLQPIGMQEGQDPMQLAVDALAAQLNRYARIYGDTGEQRWAATDREWNACKVARLSEATRAALDTIFGDVS